MPFFLYQARDKKGNLVKGQIEAPNANAAADVLLARQENTSKITLTDEDQNKNILGDLLYRVKVDDLVVFSRQMYSLTKSGIPLIRAIVGLADTTTIEH